MARDTPSFPIRIPVPYIWPMQWMRRRGDRVLITTGKYAGHTGSVESNVFQRTIDYPDEVANGFYVMLGTEVLVTVRWEQMEPVE